MLNLRPNQQVNFSSSVTRWDLNLAPVWSDSECRLKLIDEQGRDNLESLLPPASTTEDSSDTKYFQSPAPRVQTVY